MVDVGFYVFGSVESYECGIGIGSLNFDYGCFGMVYRDFRSGLYDFWLFYWVWYYVVWYYRYL